MVLNAENSIDSTSATALKHENLLHESSENVFEKFEVVELIGKGSIGDISKVRMKRGCSIYEQKKRKSGGLGLRRVFRQAADDEAGRSGGCG